MTPYKLPNANASVIAVTNTATLLEALINTAGSSSVDFPHDLDAVDLVIEDGDVRMLYDGNTPTATKGILLQQGTIHRLRGIDFNNLKLIRVGGSNVAVGVQVGRSDPNDSATTSSGGGGGGGAGDASEAEQQTQTAHLAAIETAVELIDNTVYTEGDTDASITGVPILWEDSGDTLKAVSEANPLPVQLQNNLEVVDSGGAESDSVGVAPVRRADAFQATITSADASSPTQVKAKTAAKKIYVTDLIISVGAELTVQVQDDAGIPVVLMEQVYMPANSVLPLHFQTPLMVATNQDLDVVTSGAGNISVTALGYVI